MHNNALFDLEVEAEVRQERDMIRHERMMEGDWDARDQYAYDGIFPTAPQLSPIPDVIAHFDELNELNYGALVRHEGEVWLISEDEVRHLVTVLPTLTTEQVNAIGAYMAWDDWLYAMHSYAGTVWEIEGTPNDIYKKALAQVPPEHAAGKALVHELVKHLR